jgi:hypothetical protein
MPQLAVFAWGAFSSAVVGNALAASAFLAGAGLSTGLAITLGSYGAVAYTAAQVIGGIQAVASVLGVGQKQPSLRGAWEQGRLTVDASASRKLIVGRTALSGSLRAQFQVGKYKDWFWQTIALGGAGPIESLDGVVIERVTYTINGNGQCSYAPNDMQVFFRDGAWAQSAITSFPLRNVSETPTGQWTSSHRGAGIAHVLWVARENPKVFTKGKPQPLFLVKGQTDLIDPRTGTTAGSTHRDNPAVWEYTWRLGFKSPSGYGSVDLGGFQKTVDQLDTATYAAWANRCESLGWKVSGEIDLNEDREAVSRAFCQAGAAVPIVKGGKDSVFYQSVKTSLMTLTEADFVGDIEVLTSPEIRDRSNGIVPRFRSEAHGWEQVAGSLITASSYVAEDGGSRIAEVQFPLVVSATQAGQLAAYQMVQSRERLLVRGAIHPRILAIAPGEAITINVPSRGISSVKCIMEGRTIGTDGAISCTFRSETDSKHTYATGVTTTVPDTSLPSLSDGTIDSPTAGVWTAAIAQITSDATSLPIIRVTGAVESFRVAAVLIRYRTTIGPGPWNNLAPANRDATRIEIDTVTPNTSYDLEVSYISVTGKESAWTSLGTVSTGTFVAGQAAEGIGGVPILNSLVPQSGNLWRYSLMERGARGYEAFAVSGAVVSTTPALVEFEGRRIMRSYFFSTTTNSQCYLGTNAQGNANVRPNQRYALQMRIQTEGAVQKSQVVVFWRNQADDATISAFIGPDITGLSAFETLVQYEVTAPSNAAFARVFLVTTNTNGGSLSLSIHEPQLDPMMPNQTGYPPFTPGPFGDDGADVTGVNTAAAIVGQGTGATASNLTGLNATEGGKLGGIETGATVGATVGTNFRFPDTSIAPIGRVDNALNPADGNLFRYSLMERGTRGYNAFGTGGATIVNPPYLLAFSGIRLVKTDFTSSTNGSSTYLGTNAQGLARVKPSQRYSVQARTETSGSIQSSVLAIDWRNDDNSASLGFSFSTSVSGTSPLGTLRQFFTTAPANAAFANVFLISTNTNGGAGFLALYEGQITAVTADATVHPAFTQGPFGDDGADQTGNNTAAAITGQGNNATKNTNAGLLSARPTGVDGDTYHATDTKEIYFKNGGSWVKVADVANTFSVSLSATNITASGTGTTLTTGNVTATPSGGSGSYGYAWAVITKDVQSLDPFMISQSATSACRATLGAGQAVEGTIQLTVTDLSTGAIQIKTLTYNITNTA